MTLRGGHCTMGGMKLTPVPIVDEIEKSLPF
jgi:hypothetical protein